jgi:peroxiredoxin
MRKLKALTIVFVVSSLFSAIIFADKLQDSIREVGLQPLKEGTKLIDFELEDLEGKKVKLSSLKGKVVFLNFWATWCPPCREEMPSMQKLHLELEGEGLEILAVDLQEDRKTVANFLQENGLTFKALLDRSGRVGSMYGARSIPTTYIIDKKGFVIAGVIGSRDWYTPEMVDFFKGLLAQ